MRKGAPGNAGEEGPVWKPQGKTAHQSLQGRFRKALEEKAQCVWSCVCAFAFDLRKRLSACGRETILVSKERGADYSFRPPTIPPRRPLLTRRGCRGIPPAAEKTCFFPGTILLLKERGADFAFWLPTLPPGATPAYNDGLPTMPSGGRLWPTLPRNTTPAHKGRRRPAHPV